MIFLSEAEKGLWAGLGAEVSAGRLVPGVPLDEIRSVLRPHFHFFAGGLLASSGSHETAQAWFRAGVMEETNHFMFNAFVTAFMERHGRKLIVPDAVFSDPRPYVHFTTIPSIRAFRANFLRHAAMTIPDFSAPFRFMDIGCGDGSLTVQFLSRLRDEGRIRDISDIVLVDASPAMLEMAGNRAREAFPASRVVPLRGAIQKHSASLPCAVDLALMSLSYHHLTREEKVLHLRNMRDHVPNFLLFDMDAPHDTVQLHSPALAVSIYQSYGWIIDDIFAHDAPVEISQGCVDNFIMAEVVSLLTQPRGERNDYHALRCQWRDIFDEALGTDYSCLFEATAHTSDTGDFFTMHVGR
jgi:SAM-dependent methyltransferase